MASNQALILINQAQLGSWQFIKGNDSEPEQTVACIANFKVGMRAWIIAVSLAGLFWALSRTIAATELDLPGSGDTGAILSQVAQTQDSSARRGAMDEPGAKHAVVISQFFALINDHRVSDALAMMSPELVPDADRAAWTQHFSAIKSIRVMDIRPADMEGTGLCVEYKVTIEADVSSEAANAPIPYYGWNDNPNLRWIHLCPRGDQWLISSIGTGP
jgi:hypothetical protein